MKKLGILALLIFTCLNFICSDPDDKKEEQISVSFASNVESIIGFSSSEVTSISSVKGNGSDISNTTKKFHYDSKTREYVVSDQIYAYAQIFSTSSVEVKLQLKPLVSKNNQNVVLDWKTSNAVSVYDASAESGYTSRIISSTEDPVTVFSDGVAEIPRVKSWRISPVLSSDEVNNKAKDETEFEATIVISLLINS